MGLFTKIDRDFWGTDEAREMTPEEKYFWFYLQTNSRVNTLGCYAFQLRTAADETGYNKETIEKLLQRMAELGLIDYSPETREVLLYGWGADNWNRKMLTIRSIRKDLKAVKDYNFQMWLEMKLVEAGVFQEEETTENTWEHLGTLGNTEEHSGKEEEREEEREEKKENSQKKSGGAVFRPPTLSEVEAYCRERRNRVDASRFIDFYESKGWMIGKNRMKNWKAAVRTWEKDDGRKAESLQPTRKPEENTTLLERMRMAGEVV